MCLVKVRVNSCVFVFYFCVRVEELTKQEGRAESLEKEVVELKRERDQAFVRSFESYEGVCIRV